MNYRFSDKKNIWHPYTQEQTSVANRIILSAKDEFLNDEDGHEIIDAISSWWTITHGHAQPQIAKAIATQAMELEQVIFSGFSHPKAIELAENLLRILPAYQKVFYSDNGSTAVEIGLKMAFQYWHNQGKAKSKVICFENAYHGDTFGAMSVSERGLFTSPFSPFLFEVERIPLPSDKSSLEKLKSIIVRSKENIACFIFEPLVLGAGGMLMYEAIDLEPLLAICKENKILTIADEVMTGFGRCGKLFATDFLETKTDIICLSKGITGGFMPFAATLCTDEIYQSFLSNDKQKMFFHGHSFTGNALSCAAALANIQLFETEKTLEKITQINQAHLDFIKQISSDKIKHIRCTGTILAFEVGEKNGYLSNERDRLYTFFQNENILLRPLGNTLYILPPYCISKQSLQKIYDAILKMTTLSHLPHHGIL